MSELPPLAEFLRWLAETPPVFTDAPVGAVPDALRVDAVVADLWETLFADRPGAALLLGVRAADGSKKEQNRLRWVLAACHLLWHPAFRGRRLSQGGLRDFLLDELGALAKVLSVTALREDEERREELIRRALQAAGLRLPGENEVEARDRLTQVDSVERRRLEREAADKERRAREIRERIAEQAAREAAARYSSD